MKKNKPKSPMIVKQSVYVQIQHTKYNNLNLYFLCKFYIQVFEEQFLNTFPTLEMQLSLTVSYIQLNISILNCKYYKYVHNFNPSTSL